MVITSEYSTGMIRTSLTAQPRRGVVYAAKAIAFTAVALVISVVTSFVAFLAGQALYASQRGRRLAVPHGQDSRPTRNGLPETVQVGPGAVHVRPGRAPGRHQLGRDPPVDRAGRDHRHRAVRHDRGADRVRRRLDRPAHGGHDRDRDRADVHRPAPREHAAEQLAQRHHAVPARRRNQVVSVTVAAPASPNLWSAWPQLGVTALWAAVLVAVGAYLFRKRDA